jgi:threonine efflux protein
LANLRLNWTLDYSMLSTLIAIWLLHIVATATPGANTLLVAQLAASGHGPSAVFSAIGIAIGSAIWAALAVLGVNILFATFPVLRTTLQVAGAAYLLFLAARFWSSGNSVNDIAVELFSPYVALYRGMLTNFTNPKAALFFGGIFSTCFPPNPSNMLLIASVLVVFVNAMCWYVALAYLFGCEPIRKMYMRNRGLIVKIAGALLGTIGLRFLILSFHDAKV